MSDDRDPFLMPRYFSRRFIIFGAILIIFTLIMVVFFDESEVRPIHPFRHGIPGDTTPRQPYRPVNPVTPDTAAIADTTTIDTIQSP